MEILQKLRDDFQRILGDHLVGIYVHGSVAFGCYRWDVSDVDFLAVVKETLTLSEKIALIEAILSAEEIAPKKGVEMSVVRADVLRPFLYPTPFELHYSVSHLARIRSDIREYCENMHGVDPDLVAHCTVIRAVGFALCGRPIEEVFGEVPKEYYLESIRFDVENAEDDILENPVYIILNLCRVLAYIRENAVISKKDGGLWGVGNLSLSDREMIEKALISYTEGKTYVPCGREVDFARRMYALIFS